MPFNLRHRNFLKLLDYTPDEIRYLLKLAASLKAAKEGGYEEPRLGGKNIALIFEKSSTRTRCSFEVAAYDQGAKVTYLGPTGSQIGHKESMKDTARVLGEIYDAIEYRGFGQDIVEELGEYAGVPVYNGLTNEFHPTQILCDVLTMVEHSDKPMRQIAYCFLGDCAQQYGQLADGRWLQAGYGRAPVRPQSPVAGREARRRVQGARRRDRRSSHDHRRRR